MTEHEHKRVQKFTKCRKCGFNKEVKYVCSVRGCPKRPEVQKVKCGCK
jgi:hypothetical protein